MFAEFVQTAESEPDALDQTDWARFVRFAYQLFAGWENAYLDYRRGLIDNEYWTAWDGANRRLLTGAGYRRFWEQEREGHAPLFQRYIDEKVFF